MNKVFNFPLLDRTFYPLPPITEAKKFREFRKKYPKEDDTVEELTEEKANIIARKFDLSENTVGYLRSSTGTLEMIIKALNKGGDGANLHFYTYPHEGIHTVQSITASIVRTCLEIKL